ncbi:D-alanyl-D-alanine carboxypeptidase [Streptomyces klenkii]|uniref:D-alanyl-D-alanine carboxypeptidase n=1 Tax=Streptomyces klenkii TaxID=1420899 RepID=UPI0033CC76E0
MAGESPGKSEQRKSSGETTRGEHDPRLGVFRESSGKPSGKADAADAADAAEGGRKEVSAAPAEADAIAKADSGPTGRTAGGDARLKAAVAAWVAGTDEDGDDAGEPDSSAKTSGAAARPKATGTGDEPVNGSPSGKDDEPAAADRPVNGAPSGNGKAPASEDRATAVFGALRPKGAASAADDAEAPKAAKPAKDEPSGNGKSEASSDAARPKADGEDSGSGNGKAPASADSKDKGKDSDSASGKDKPAAAGDQATAVFRTVRPKNGEAGKTAAADGAANGSPSGNGKAPASADSKDKGKDSGSADRKPAAAGDQATAVFRTVRPKDGDAAGSGAASGNGKAPASGEGKAPASGKDKPAASAAPADQATAVFGAIRPKADEADKPSSDDQPTALIKAPKVPEPKAKPEAASKAKAEAKPDAESKAKAGAAKAAPREDSDSERTSQFVPLKSDEAPAAPAKKAAPAKPGTPAKPPVKAAPPAPKASGTPAKPAIPVTVTPPKDPADPASPQQAGGPAAPLDLLAQLTNTPPPPETPVRTVLRRVKIWTPLVVLLAIIFCVVQAFRPLPEPKLVLTANKAFKFDGDKAQMTWPASGQAYVEVDGLGSLGEFGEEKPVPIASVTKVMTAYITLRDHPMKKGDKKGALMTVDAKAVSDYQKGKPEGESLVRVTENQQLSEYEALEALMLPSANNIAKLLARWDAGSEDAFVKKMNDTAKELGMVNTHFTDPSGFDATTKSTAKDLVKLGKKAMADPVFKEISGLTEYIDSNGEKQKNFNPIVPLYGTGIKTGTTTAAGGNLLFAAEKKIGGTTQLIIGAVLAQHKTPIIDSVVAATKDAIESAKKALEAKTVVKKGDVVGAVDDGLGGRTPVVATKDVTAVGWAGLSVDLALNDAGHKLPHTAKSGTEVGMLTVGSGPGQVRVPVALKKELAEPGFGSKLTRLG